MRYPLLGGLYTIMLPLMTLLTVLLWIVLVIAVWKLMRAHQSIANSMEIAAADLMDRLDRMERRAGDDKGA